MCLHTIGPSAFKLLQKKFKQLLYISNEILFHVLICFSKNRVTRYSPLLLKSSCLSLEEIVTLGSFTCYVKPLKEREGTYMCYAIAYLIWRDRE